MQNNSISPVVYLIQDSNYLVKIGVTSNLNLRVHHIGSSHDNPIKLIYSIDCPDMESARKLESMLHNRYSQFRVTGEWFKDIADKVINDLIWALAIAPNISKVNKHDHIITKLQEDIKPKPNRVTYTRTWVNGKCKYICSECGKTITRQAWQKHKCRLVNRNLEDKPNG